MGISTCLKHITVEPITFLYIFSWSLMSPTENFFFYQRACSVRYNDEAVCNNLQNSSYAAQEILVQSDLAQLQFYTTFSGRIFPIFLAIMFGILTDKYGPKLTMFISLLGAISETTLYIAMALNPTWPIELYLLAKGVSGITGGVTAYFLGMFSFITSVTSEKNRTGRMGIADGVATFGHACGYLLSGVILEATSFIFMFSLNTGLHIVAVLYLLVCIKTKEKKSHNTIKKDINPTDSDVIEEMHEERMEHIQLNAHRNSGYKIDEKNLNQRQVSRVACINIAKEMLRKRPRNGRTHFIILLIIMFFLIFGNVPFYTLVFLYTKLQPLSWSQSLYGLYKGITCIGQSIGEVLVFPFLKRIKIKDTYLMFAGILSEVILGLMLSWARTTWMIFLGGNLAFFAGNMFTCCRSMISFLLHENEVGKVYAVIGSIQGISEMAACAFFPIIYSISLTKLWPGFSFFLGSIIYVIPFLLGVWLHFDYRKKGIFTDESSSAKKYENKDEE